MILTYHKISPETKTQWWISPDAFYRQMVDLKSKKMVYLDDYDPEDPSHCVITFDGVYDNVLKYAVPILRHFGYPFELFIVGKTVGGDNSFDTIEPLTQFASHEMLAKMVKAGGRLQWHSWSHPLLLGNLPENVYEQELSIPADLRDLCSDGFKWFAYPHGQRDNILIEKTKKYFAGGLACDDGGMGKFDLQRITVFEDARFSSSKVSLIIPCYNYGHFAAEAIESALSQTHPPDEILFIDDDSSDNSLEVARRYEPQIRVVANEKNLGIVENFKKAISLTSGDYICFLGSDNRFRSDYVEKARILLDANPEVAVIYTHFVLFDKRASVEALKFKANPHPVFPEFFLKKFPENPQEDIHEQNYIHGSSMYRRIAYEQAGGYIDASVAEDHSLFARMLGKGWKAKLLDEYVLEYRQHSNDQTNITKGLQMENVYLRSHARSLWNQLQETSAQMAAAQSQLKEITNSNAWKVVRLFRLILPPNSFFARVLRGLSKFIFLPFIMINRNRNIKKDLILIRNSGLFDDNWYLANYPDVAQAKIDPTRHYLFFGGFEGRDPCPSFSSALYLAAHEDVKKSGINPLIHYLKSGRNEGRMPHASQVVSNISKMRM